MKRILIGWLLGCIIGMTANSCIAIEERDGIRTPTTWNNRYKELNESEMKKIMDENSANHSIFSSKRLGRLYADGLPQHRSLRKNDPEVVYLDQIAHLHTGGIILTSLLVYYAPLPVAMGAAAFWWFGFCY